MIHHYPDITSRIAESPKWFDSNGVPRYGEFSPDLCPNIYARQVCLFEIACQNCDQRMLVEASCKRFGDQLDILIREKALHYGDPPDHGDCLSGPTMNSIGKRTVQFWKRGKLAEWARVPELENVDIEPDWATEDRE